MPKETLALGEYLVHELNLQDGVDTLGRWMAHHLAEIINNAERGKTPAVRRKATMDATKLIMEIWSKRTALPGNAYPLAEYQDALKFLTMLQPASNPFRFSAVSSDQHAANIFSNLAYLILFLFRSKFSQNKTKSKKIRSKAAVIKALSKKERKILIILEQWLEIIRRSQENYISVRVVEKAAPPNANPNSQEFLFSIIDSTIANLTSLRTELSKSRDPVAEA